MQRMTGIDPMFIYSDTPETPMEIAYACVFDPSSAPDGYAFEHVQSLLEERIPTLPSFRRRLMTDQPATLKGGWTGFRAVSGDDAAGNTAATDLINILDTIEVGCGSSGGTG